MNDEGIPEGNPVSAFVVECTDYGVRAVDDALPDKVVVGATSPTNVAYPTAVAVASHMPAPGARQPLGRTSWLANGCNRRINATLATTPAAAKLARNMK